MNVTWGREVVVIRFLGDPHEAWFFSEVVEIDDFDLVGIVSVWGDKVFDGVKGGDEPEAGVGAEGEVGLELLGDWVRAGERRQGGVEGDLLVAGIPCERGPVFDRRRRAVELWLNYRGGGLPWF